MLYVHNIPGIACVTVLHSKKWFFRVSCSCTTWNTHQNGFFEEHQRKELLCFS